MLARMGTRAGRIQEVDVALELFAGFLPRGPVTVMVKIWPSRTDIFGMKVKEGRRRWIISLGQEGPDEASWDHCPIFATKKENEAQNYFFTMTKQ